MNPFIGVNLLAVRVPSTATPDLPHLQFLMTGDWGRSQLLRLPPPSPHQQQSGAAFLFDLKDCSNEGPCAPNGHLGETLFHRPETGTRLHPCSVEVGGGERGVGGWGQKKGSVLAKYLLLFDPIWFSVFWCLHFNDPRSVSERWHVCP